MNKPGLNDFLSAFFGAKITGKGKKGNAKIYTKQFLKWIRELYRKSSIQLLADLFRLLWN